MVPVAGADSSRAHRTDSSASRNVPLITQLVMISVGRGLTPRQAGREGPPYGL